MNWSKNWQKSIGYYPINVFKHFTSGEHFINEKEV